MDRSIAWCCIGATLLAGVILWPARVAAQEVSTSTAQVWFSPNVASVDMLDLFTQPDDWADARQAIDVFKFDSGHVGSAGWSCNVIPTEVCGDNHLQNFVAVDAFATVASWGKELALESFFAGPLQAIDPIQCSTSQHVWSLTLNGSINIITSVQSNGGVVASLAMDEPLRQWLPAYFYDVTGTTDPRPCLIDSIDVLADHMAAYLLQMQQWYPDIVIGQIDLYPEISVARYQEWILALEARGVSLAFLHLDVHKPRVDQYNSFGFNIDMAADFVALQQFLAPRGIDFGMILTDVDWNGQLWEPGEYTDAVYFQATQDWAAFIDATGVAFDHKIFQSWVKPYTTAGEGPLEVPLNLPDNDPAVFSHTRLIRDLVAVPTTTRDLQARRFLLRPVHPNPVQHQRTTISYELTQDARVQLQLYDVRGRLVRGLVDRRLGQGVQRFELDTRGLQPGVYVVHLQAQGRSEGRKLLVGK